MYSRILVATDGSAHANRASEHALNLARQFPGAHVTLFHVTPSLSRGHLIKSQFDIKSMLEDEAHQHITRTECNFREAGIPFQVEVALGDPAAEIIHKAETEAFDLLILGSRGLNKFKEFVLGSVSNQVAHEVKCPVLIVK
ncbi:universal stress protein [Marinicrinis sediminis]|uniref:Universal stress protein n=1 Tax=Marinicrinis sediminis TaxID=1652465 RepID=A0ABW5RDS0_9BACL